MWGMSCLVEVEPSVHLQASLCCWSGREERNGIYVYIYIYIYWAIHKWGSQAPRSLLKPRSFTLHHCDKQVKRSSPITHLHHGVCLHSPTSAPFPIFHLCRDSFHLLQCSLQLRTKMGCPWELNTATLHPPHMRKLMTPVRYSRQSWPSFNAT